MFDIGWSELAVIAVVAVVFIGPKDLPLALKAIGQWVGRARALAREFQGSVDEMIREAEKAAEIDKLKKEVTEAADAMDVSKEIDAARAEIDKSLEMPSIEMDPTRTPTPETTPEKPVESVAAPPADAPIMPLPSMMPSEPAPEPVVASKHADKTEAAPPPRAASTQF